MCGRGGSKSADEYYSEMKPPPADLPSLSVGDKVNRETKYNNVERKKTGVKRRSLLSYFGVGSKASN